MGGIIDQPFNYDVDDVGHVETSSFVLIEDFHGDSFLAISVEVDSRFFCRFRFRSSFDDPSTILQGFLTDSLRMAPPRGLSLKDLSLPILSGSFKDSDHSFKSWTEGLVRILSGSPKLAAALGLLRTH